MVPVPLVPKQHRLVAARSILASAPMGFAVTAARHGLDNNVVQVFPLHFFHLFVGLLRVQRVHLLRVVPLYYHDPPGGTIVAKLRDRAQVACMGVGVCMM